MTISYELAKELKDAGFPQLGRHFYWSTHTEPPTYWCINALEQKESAPPLSSEWLTAAPTLSELIEACGEDFIGLLKQNGGFKATSRFSIKDGVASNEEWFGTTPDAAMALLWLALHPKNA